jgi:hypothetical protein
MIYLVQPTVEFVTREQARETSNGSSRIIARRLKEGTLPLAWVRHPRSRMSAQVIMSL